MPRFFKTVLILGPILMCPAVRGELPGYRPAEIQPGAQAQQYSQRPAYPGQQIRQTHDVVVSGNGAGAMQGVEGESGMYPILNAPLYPCPRPNIPTGVGRTVITNPALAPHEMLYKHRNTGLYGPFYYKTKRNWLLTPLGIHTREKRVLTGTTVDVKYKSHISPFALYSPSAR